MGSYLDALIGVMGPTGPVGPTGATGPTGAAPSGVTYFASAAVTTTDNTTVMNLLTVTLPRGMKSWVRSLLIGVRQSDDALWVVESRSLIRNTSGTPAQSGGTYTPSGGLIVILDETSGALAGSVIASSTGTDTFTSTIKGPGAYAVKWSSWGEVISFPL